METQIVLLNSSTVVNCIVEDFKKTGPRWPGFSKVKRLTIIYVIKHWGSLTASAGEIAWARRKIAREVALAYSWWQVFLIKILVSVIIDWFLKRRNKDFDDTINELRANVW